MADHARNTGSLFKTAGSRSCTQVVLVLHVYIEAQTRDKQYLNVLVERHVLARLLGEAANKAEQNESMPGQRR